MASVDFTYFTDAEMPQENMKDWHTCLKAKQISLFLKLLFPLLLAHFCFCSCFSSSLHQHTSLFVWRTCPSPYMNVCLYLYVHILYKYIKSVLCLQRRVLSLTCPLNGKTVLRFDLIVWSPGFSSTCTFRLSSYTSVSVTIHLLCHTTINYSPF